MNIIKADLEPSFILHTRPYRDTSLLVELLTRQYGRLTVVARGARSSKSKLAGLLMPFLPLLISFRSKGGLGNLYQADLNGFRYDISGKVLLSGFYLNELLIKLLPCYEPYSNVFQAYQNTLDRLANCNAIEPELRVFEKTLISNLGYGLQLDKTFDGKKIFFERSYCFEFGKGFFEADSRYGVAYSGKSLLALHEGVFSAEEELQDAKRLLRIVLSELLGGKKIKTRELFY